MTVDKNPQPPNLEADALLRHSDQLAIDICFCEWERQSSWQNFTMNEPVFKFAVIYISHSIFFFFFSLKNKAWHFMWTVCSKRIFYNILCCCWDWHINFYHSLLYKFSQWQIDSFLSFFQKTEFDISCKICKKCQNYLFSGKKKWKNISICHLLKILPKILRIKDKTTFPGLAPMSHTKRKYSLLLHFSQL